MADVGNINLRALQLFIAVYDSHSFSVVARREGVSPSLISRVIQQLEDALGQQLFYRNTRAAFQRRPETCLLTMPADDRSNSLTRNANYRIAPNNLADSCASTPRSTLANGISRHG